MATTEIPPARIWLAGEGEMAQRIRDYDWAATPLGPIASWPQSLCTVIDIVLASGFPMALMWGPQLRVFYNDAYREVMSRKHPDALGQPAQEVWPEAWPRTGPTFRRVLAGETVTRTDASYAVERNGTPGEAWFTFSCSPLRDDEGMIAGVLIALIETTERLQARTVVEENEKRQAFLLRLSDALRPLADPDQIEAEATRVLGEHFGARRAYYATTDPETGTAVINRDYVADGVTSVVGRYRIEDFPGTSASMVQEGACIVHDITVDPRFSEAERAQLIELSGPSFVGIPIVKDDIVRGAVGVTASAPRTWTPDEVALVDEVGERIWTAVERVRAETALQQSEAMLSTVLQAAPVAIGFFDVSGRILLSNPVMQRYLPSGIIPSHDPLRVDRWAAFEPNGEPIPPDEYPGSRALRGLPTVPGLEMRYLTDEGEDVWTRVSTLPLRDEHGEVTSQVAVITDIDELKRTAETLRQSEASLQQRVADATQELRTLSRRLLLVQEEERRRLALELHDEIGQVLTGLTFQLAAARGQHSDAAVQAANTTVQRLTEQVRQLALDLRPVVLDTHGLLAAVEWHLVRFQQRTGITVHLSHEHVSQRYAPEVEIAAFRVVQEAMTNVARHAGVSEAWVTLFGESRLLLVISDRGRGFDPEQIGESSGLGGMRERVELLGGTWDLETAPGAGVQITAQFPLDVPGTADSPESVTP